MYLSTSAILSPSAAIVVVLDQLLHGRGRGERFAILAGGPCRIVEGISADLVQGWETCS